VSGSNAPREIEDGLASSPANIDRDQGVGYESALDRLDRVQVAQLEATEVHPVRGRAHLVVLSASGTLRYIALDRLGRAEVPGQLGMEARPRDVALVLIRWNLGAGGFQRRSVPNGATTHTDGA